MTDNPGSKEAIDKGCLCPRMDNGNGKGSMWGSGTYVIRCDCPLHGDTTQEKQNKMFEKDADEATEIPQSFPVSRKSN